MSEIMKIIDKREKQKKNTRKEEGGDSGYSERVRSK